MCFSKQLIKRVFHFENKKKKKIFFLFFPGKQENENKKRKQLPNMALVFRFSLSTIHGYYLWVLLHYLWAHIVGKNQLIWCMCVGCCVHGSSLQFQCNNVFGDYCVNIFGYYSWVTMFFNNINEFHSYAIVVIITIHIMAL